MEMTMASPMMLKDSISQGRKALRRKVVRMPMRMVRKG